MSEDTAPMNMTKESLWGIIETKDKKIAELEAKLNKQVAIIKEVMKLIDDGILIRNIDNDGDFMAFVKQGIQLTQILKSAQEILEEE